MVGRILMHVVLWSSSSIIAITGGLLGYLGLKTYVVAPLWGALIARGYTPAGIIQTAVFLVFVAAILLAATYQNRSGITE